jgi:type I restriction enzyme S subunit
MNVYRHENINNESIKTFQIVTAKDNQIESCSLKKGDILFTPSSETPDDIGHSVVIFEDLENAVFSYHLMRFRPNIEIDILYSHYFCNIPDVLAQLSKLATGSTRFTISVGSFSSVLIKLPSIGEQKYIADFLSEIDRKINSTNILITQTEIWKKGLLQKMFVKE